MDSKEALIKDLKTLNLISETLNQSVDVHSALNATLARLVDLMGLRSGWITLSDPSTVATQKGSGFSLVAHYNLPPALALDNDEVWRPLCDCQRLCLEGRLVEAYNEVKCSRLAAAKGDRRGLVVHASAPLRSGNHTLGILNVAAEDWSSFDDRSLALLTNAGMQIGIALERAQLYDTIRERRIDEQAALLSFSNHLLAYKDFQELMDYLVREVARLLKADACALVLLCEDRELLRFRSAYGWNLDPVEASRTIPADARSGPGWVMQTQKPLLVEDLREHDPTHWAPDWLCSEDYRGHAVLPLVAEGSSIGALIINDRKPRLIAEDELLFLQVMADQAAIAIESARLREEEIKNQRLEEEMAVGRQIQLSLLPEKAPFIPGWELVVDYRAARQMGGDFYDFFDLPGGSARRGLVIADVSGKGIPAALFMAMCRTTIRSIALGNRGPSEVLTDANKLILHDSSADFFLSIFYAILETETGHVTFANGGHTRPLWLHAATGEVTELRSDGIILGSFDEIDVEEKEGIIDPGDVLLLYTDGVTDAADENDQLFGKHRLVEILTAQPEASAGRLAAAVLDAIEHFTGSTPQSDDLTILILRRLPAD
jgi:serine phosphatase RsbU (regulator of sigma subunit)